MLNKLSNFALAAVLFVSLGCARQYQPMPPPAAPPTQVALPPAPAPAAKHYSVGAPGWVLVEESEMEGNEPQRVAEYEYKASDDLSFGAYVTEMKLDAVDAVTYLEKMREEANSSDRIKVIGQRMTKAGGLEAYEILTALKLERGVAIVLGIFVTDPEGRAFYVTCGGNIVAADAVLTACRPFIRSFRIGE